MEAVENLKEKQRAHAEIAKRLEEAEAAMNKLREKEKIIKEQAASLLPSYYFSSDCFASS